MAIINNTSDCGIRFVCDNYIETAEITVVEGIENAQFPISNLFNPTLGKYARLESQDVKIVIDLRQVRNIDSFAVLGNPQNTFGISSASFKTAALPDFTNSPSFDIELNAQQNLGYIFLQDPVAHRYVEFTFTGTGAYTEIGRIVIGEHFHLPQNNLAIGSFAYGYTDLSTITKNQYSQRFVDKRNLVKTLGGTIESCTKEEMDLIDTMFINNGRHDPIFMVTDIGGNSFIDSEHKLTVYGYFENQPCCY